MRLIIDIEFLVLLFDVIDHRIDRVELIRFDSHSVRSFRDQSRKNVSHSLSCAILDLVRGTDNRSVEEPVYFLPTTSLFRATASVVWLSERSRFRYYYLSYCPSVAGRSCF